MRKPAVAFQFYPGDPEELKRSVIGFLGTKEEREKVLGLIAPHAGYVYSGKVAGSVYSGVTIPDDVILLGPNHTGLGVNASLMASGEWQMPFGSVPVNESLASLILEESQLLTKDSLAHIREHSLEVQLPFIYYINPNIKVVPITLMSLSYNSCLEIGKDLARALKRYTYDTLIVVSSDMNHYENQEITEKKDKAAIEKILELDPESLYNVVGNNNISMCGIIPTTIALITCNELGAKEARLVDHATSGDVSGDYDHVVGYAGIVIK